jgi:hypothetical protein
MPQSLQSVAIWLDRFGWSGHHCNLEGALGRPGCRLSPVATDSARGMGGDKGQVVLCLINAETAHLGNGTDLTKN